MRHPLAPGHPCPPVDLGSPVSRETIWSGGPPGSSINQVLKGFGGGLTSCDVAPGSQLPAPNSLLEAFCIRRR